MRKKQNDWTCQMRRRLADHEAPVPDDLWNRIERRLDDAEAPTASSANGGDTDGTAAPVRRVGMRRIALWAVSAAAAVALVVALGYRANDDTIMRLAQHDGGGVAHRDTDHGQMPTDRPTCADAATTATTATRMGYVAQVAAKPHATAIGTTAVNHATVDEPTVTSTNDDGVAVAQAEEAERTVAEAAPSAVGTAAPSPRRTTQRNAQTMATWQPATSHHEGRQRFVVGTHMGGAMANNRATTFRGRGMLCSSSLFAMGDDERTDGTLMATNAMLLSRYSETKHHAQPMTLGVSLGYALNDRLTLTTGVVYTRAVSDFTKSSGDDEIVETQKLHYVGVPLGVKYGLWGNRLLQLYATVGGEADFNVAASVESGGVTTDAERDHVQLSANAAAGIQLNCMPHVGVFAEPGVRYYFDNHSSVETIFKDKPWAFSMQIGVRAEF